MKSWTEYWISMAKHVSTKSKDQSTKCGAAIVDRNNQIVSTGFNGFPHGIDDENPEYHKRPRKYDMTEHAERNAIYAAAGGRGGTRGATMYLGHSPRYGICTDCARAIIQAGIVKVVGPDEEFQGKGEQWLKNVRTAHHMLTEAGVYIATVQEHNDATHQV